GNGYYEVTMIPSVAAGTAYSVTASKTGATSQTLNASVLAGDIVRYDFVIDSGLPTAPSGLAATTPTQSQINLTCKDNSRNESAFVVARSTASHGPYTDIATLPANSVSYTNTLLPGGTTYYYVVRTTNGDGASTNSSEAGATTLIDSPPVIASQPQSQTIVVN